MYFETEDTFHVLAYFGLGGFELNDPFIKRTTKGCLPTG